MNDEDIHPFCAELNEFLARQMNYKNFPCNAFHNKIHARTNKFSLTLSWGWSPQSIAITAISFKKQRQGHCTALLMFLCSVAKKYGYERIEFISVCTEEMRAFVTKFGFINHPAVRWPGEPEEASRDWSKQIQLCTFP